MKPPWCHLLAAILAFTPFVTAAGADRLTAAVQPYIERSELAGAVMLVADKDEVLTIEAAGWADIAARKPMQPDTLFWIASQSKPVTASALMILVDEGKVALDDPIEKFLPEFKDQMLVNARTDESLVLRKPSLPVTVRHILSHTAGFPFKSLIEEPTLDLLPLAARVRSYAMTPLDSEPGTNYRYSNAGINTAARIIEVVTGQAFEDFLAERLFRPLGMTDTTFWPDQDQLARLALSYRPGPGKTGLEPLEIDQLHYPLDDRAKRFPVPAGDLFSTAGDIARFYRMLLHHGEIDGHRYLSPEAVEQLTTKQTPVSVETGYGLGFKVTPGSFGHGGAYSTNSGVETESGLILIWLVQHASFPGNGKESIDSFRNAALSAYAGK